MTSVISPYELAELDEVATALILDPYLKFTTHKINVEYKSRFDHATLNKIWKQFLNDQDYHSACRAYLQIANNNTCLEHKNISEKLITAYLKLLDINSRVGIQECFEYSREEYCGAKLVAKRRLMKGDILEELFGLYAPVDEDIIVTGKNDFSVMTIKSKDYLLLGPLSFVNHSCNPNCRYTVRNGLIIITVLSTLNCGDEITVYYGKHFFGMNNKFCECAQCKRKIGTRGRKLIEACFTTTEVDNFGKIILEKERDTKKTRLLNPSIPSRYVVTDERPLKETGNVTETVSLNPTQGFNAQDDLLEIVQSPHASSDNVEHYLITPKKFREQEKTSTTMKPRKLFQEDKFENDNINKDQPICNNIQSNAIKKVSLWIENQMTPKKISEKDITDDCATKKKINNSNKDNVENNPNQKTPTKISAKNDNHPYMLRKRNTNRIIKDIVVREESEEEPYEDSSESYQLDNCTHSSSVSSVEKYITDECATKTKINNSNENNVENSRGRSNELIHKAINNNGDLNNCNDLSNSDNLENYRVTSNEVVHKAINDGDLNNYACPSNSSLQENKNKHKSVIIHPSSALCNAFTIDHDNYFDDEITALLDANQKQTPHQVEPRKEGGSKRQACMYCGKLFTQLPRHLRRQHSNEIAVAKMDSFSKNSKERMDALKELRIVGNFKHNCRVTASNVGELVVKRRPSKYSASTNEFCPCPNCGQYVKSTNLMRHAKHCTEGEIHFDRIKHRARMLLPSSKDASSTLREYVFSTMKCDEISNVVVRDKLICMLGSRLCEQLGNKLDIKQKGVVAQRLRLMGRLLLTLTEIDSEIKELGDLFKPSKFDLLVSAAQCMSGNFAKPSVALKVGHCMGECANILYGHFLREGRKEMLSEIRNFLHLLTTEWKYKISGVALRAIGDAKYNKEIQLPLAKDVQKLTHFIINEEEKLQSEIIERNDYTTYLKLARITLCRLIIFNRKRVGDVDRFTTHQFDSRSKQHNEDIFNSLSDAEKQLSHMFVHVEVKGKRGRKVPLLIPKQTEASLKLLIAHRERCGVLPTNPFVFALKNCMNYIRGTDALKSVVSRCALEHPERMKSTKFRKQVATMSQIMSLRPHEMEGLANFMGHDYAVHKHFYRLPESALHMAKFSKLFLAMESGNASKYKGRNLDNIDIDDIALNSNESSDDDNENETSENVEISVNIGDKPMLRVDNICKQKNQNSKSQGVVKRWSPEEVNIMKKHFAYYLNGNFGVPGKTECETVLNTEPSLKSRTWKHLKFWVYNHQKKNKKR